MAEQALIGSIAAPGFYGLNTQDSSIQLNSGFALQAYNCIIDKYGRIGARQGWDNLNSSMFGSSSHVRSIFEFVKSDGNLTFACANNKIYGTNPATGAYVEYPVGGVHFYSGTYSQTALQVTVSTVENHNLSVGETVYFKAETGLGSEGFHVVTAVDSAKIFRFNNTISQSTSGNCLGINILTSYTITADNWQFVSMPYGTGLNASAHAIAVQEGHLPLVIHKLGTVAHSHVDGYGFQRLGDVSTLPSGYSTTTFKPSCALSDYGRLWVAGVDPTDTQTIYWSDLQNSGNWTTGTAGKLDISTVIPTGDPIVALASHNNFLIIFCKRHIVIYSGATNPSTMVLSDVIKGIGCVARDSVQSVSGTDILFLSETGVQSLQRVIQEKSLPFRDVSKNVRDELIQAVRGESLSNVKAVYYPRDAFYLLSLPSSDIVYCFDTRGTLENGASRVTVWDSLVPTAFNVSAAGDLQLGCPGYLGKYTNYTDNGTKYRIRYYTNYFDFDSPSSIKILKKIGLVAIGGSNQPIIIKYGFDYTFTPLSQPVVLEGATVYEYGIAEYGIAEYATGVALDNVQAQLGGSGKVLQLGFEADISGIPLSIQKIDFSLKQGKNLI
jgi:hypothetical protein